MPDKRIQNRKKLQTCLRQLFQFDSADLDFGIYRIMNQKREDIERFIEHDLLDAVEEGLAEFHTAEREELEKLLAGKRAKLVPRAFDEKEKVVPPFDELPDAKEYMRAWHALKRLDVAEETEARIFNDLWRFFSRYYDEGDFLTERRYSSREAKYCVPYSGEEVLLHWANREQYYVKTTERFTDYRFTAGAYTIWFRLQRADVPQDNVKGNTRHFVLRAEEPLAYSPETQTLTIFFEYRPITEEEEQHLLGIYNARQTKSNRRKMLDRSVLCVALESEILDGLDASDLKACLAAVPRRREQAALGNSNPSTGSSGRCLLGQHLNRYTARHTMDYFVHKNLGGFLRRELDVFLKNEVLRMDDVIADESGEMMQHVLTRMRVVRQIAHKIIDFLAQIEDFQKRLFEKKKFVVQTDYCLTLDLVPEEFYPEILANEAQLSEWRQIYAMDKWENDLFWQGEYDEAFLQNHPYMMVDTAFFDADFKARLLATFDDFDNATDGLLIHGENFQALNLLGEKYRGRVKCIYLDPPYNTGRDDFLYKDNYQHSSWLDMMADRLRLGRGLLREDGAFFVSIGDDEQARLKLLMSETIGDGCFAAQFIWQTKKGGGQSTSYYKGHEYVMIYSKRPDIRLQLTKRNVNYSRYMSEIEKGETDHYIRRDGEWYLVNDDVIRKTHGKYEAGTERRLEYEDIEAERGVGKKREVDAKLKSGEYILVPSQTTPGKHYVARLDPIDYRQNLYSIIQHQLSENAKAEIEALLGIELEQQQYFKPVGLVRLLANSLYEKNALVLDFFAGSGTTAHATMDVNREDGGDRKYILVEIGDYFDTVLKPRIQKVAFSANWKDGVPQDRDGMSHMFKYQRIESYEDALNNIRVRQPEGAQRRLLYDEFDDYMLHYMLDFETRDSPTLLTQEAFETPFDYMLKIQRGQESPQDEKIDLVETFHYLIGMHVRRLEQHEHQGRRYVVSRGEVRTERGVEKVVVIWRDSEDLDLNREADWANEALLTETVDRVYVNGPSFIKKAEPLEITFRNRMG